jgi:hypothetical protein
VKRAAFALILLSACATPRQIPMRVLVEPPGYVVWMSSAVGLGLTPIAETPRGMKVRYRWTTDGGFFIGTKEETSEILNYGRETVTEGGKLLWSYNPNEQSELENRPVSITVATENLKDGKVVAVTDMRLLWDGQLFRPAH